MRGITLLVVVGVIVAGSLYMGSGGDDPDTGTRALVEGPPTPPWDDRRLPVVRPSRDQFESMEVEVAAEAASPPDSDQVAAPVALPYVTRDGSPNRYYVDPQYFEDKYAEATRAELLLAKEELRDAVIVSTQESINTFLDAGGGESRIVAKADQEALMDAPPPIPIHEQGLIRAARSETMSDGSLLVTSGALPWPDFSSLYDRQDELFWLIQELNAMKMENIAPADG